MAKVNFGPLANDARNKINGIVYSKNKSGAYTRKKVTPANPNTPAQSGVRTNFAQLSKDWSGTLTQPERDSWTTFANTYPRLDVFGASILITGLNMFLSLNTVLLNTGNGLETSAPPSNVVTPISYDPNTFAVVGGVSPQMKFSQLAAPPSASEKFYIFATKALPPGRAPQKNNFRFLTTQTQTAGSFPQNNDVQAAYVAKNGSIVTGMRYALLVATFDTTTGLVTVGTILQAIAT